MYKHTKTFNSLGVRKSFQVKNLHILRLLFLLVFVVSLIGMPAGPSHGPPERDPVVAVDGRVVRNDASARMHGHERRDETWQTLRRTKDYKIDQVYLLGSIPDRADGSRGGDGRCVHADGGGGFEARGGDRAIHQPEDSTGAAR